MTKSRRTSDLVNSILVNPDNSVNIHEGTESPYFLLTTGATTTPEQGMLFWDADRQTAGLQMNGVEARLGQDNFWYVKNQSGSDILKGTVVMAVGALGASSRILVAPMVADGSVDAIYVLGITAEDILNGEDGFVMNIGKIRGIDTTQYGTQAGQVLYCDPAVPGGLTITQPDAPNLDIPIAFTVDYKSNGTLAVRVNPGYHIGELHDVYSNSPSNNDILLYNSTNSRWENTPLASAVPTPTLQAVTDAGNTTTNEIVASGLNVDSGTLYVDSVNDRVGIGTTSPAYKFELVGENPMYIKAPSGDTRGILAYIPNGSVYGGQPALTENRVVSGFRSYWYNEYWQFGASRGSSTDIDGFVFSKNGTVGMAISGGLNVLIGTTTDSGYKLDVNGTARVTSELIVQDIYIGKGGDDEETNTAVGYNALANNTVPYFGAGFRNTAFGYNALFSNTTGSRNTSVGRGAGESNTTGASNVFLGESSGQQNIIGSSNVYIGHGAGGVQDSSGNTYVGTSAGYSAAQGTGNSVYIGLLAGHATTGGDNVFLGNNAGFGSTKSDWLIIGNRNNAGLIEGNFATGNVLIGTSTDSGYKLDVNGTSRFTGGGLLLSENNSFDVGILNGQGAQLWLTTTDATSQAKRIAITGNSAYNYYIWFYRGDSGIEQEWVEFDAGNSRVGINKTSPSYTLDVNGTLAAQLTNASNINQVYYSSATGELTYERAVIQVLSPTLISDIGTARYSHYSGDKPSDSPSAARGAGWQIEDGAASAGLHIDGSNAYIRFASGGDISVGAWRALAQQSWVTSQGYLTSETDTLDSVTTRGNTTTNSITVGGLTVDTDTLVVDSSNNRVGIGISSPNEKLEVYESIDGGVSIEADNPNSGTSAYTRFIARSNAGAMNFFALSSNYAGSNQYLSDSGLFEAAAMSNGIGLSTTVDAPIRFWQANAEKARINTGGNFLIGTTTDSGYKLDVNGVTFTRGLISRGVGANSTVIGLNASVNGTDGVAIGDGAECWYNLGSNAVAIGVNSTASLGNSTAIGGNSRAAGAGSVAIGANTDTGDNGGIAIGQSATTSAYGMAIGHTAVGSQQNSIAIGRVAQATVDGAISIGQNANSSGIGGIAMGRSAIASSTTGAIAIGDQSASYSGGTAVGYTAVASFGGTAIGRNATYNSGGSRFVAVGDAARATSYSVTVGYAANSISSAVAMGHEAYSNSNSVAIGDEVKAYGGSSVVLGRKANSLGDTAISIGYYCRPRANSIAIGYFAANQSTGEDNIFLGYNVGVSSTVSDWLIIGNRNNPSLIEGNFATGNVMIGTSTDSGYKLDVNGTVNANDFSAGGLAGYTGTITIDQSFSGLPPINIEVNGGIITNVI